MLQYEPLADEQELPADGNYTETVYTDGVVRPIGLPGVEIDLDVLFDVRGR